MFDFIVVGGASRSQFTHKWKPPAVWYEQILWKAREAGCLVYVKDNLCYAPKELPWMNTPVPDRAPAAFFTKRPASPDAETA